MPKARSDAHFSDRFVTRQQAMHYRDRFVSGKRARTNRREREVLGQVLRDIGKTTVALDLACGTGRLSPVLAAASSHIILADASEAMLHVARESQRLEAAEYIVTRAEQTGLPDASVDVVLCHRFLNHVHVAGLRQQVLKELRRVSRGHVILSYYGPGLLLLRWLRSWVRRCLGRDPDHGRSVSWEQFVKEASDAGLKKPRRYVLRGFPRSAEFVLFSVS